MHLVHASPAPPRPLRETKDAARLPTERPYPLPDDLARTIGATVRHGSSPATG